MKTKKLTNILEGLIGTTIRYVPIKEVYDNIYNYWKRLSDLFGKKDPRGPPRIMVSWEDGILESERVHPDDKDLKDVTPIFRGISYYWEKKHLIHFDREATKNDDFQYLSPHETTHSVISIKEYPFIGIGIDSLRDFNANTKDLGEKIYDATKEAMDKKGYHGRFREVNLSMNEFFPPLGVYHLLGTFEKWDWINKLGDQIQKEDNLSTIKGYIEHLPDLAGELLVQQYKGDVRALMREHPQLPNLSGPELWEWYCKPLLEKGRLK